MRQRSSGSLVKSVQRAIAILKSFSADQPERGVNELGRELDLHKSTVSRLMQTLAYEGLLSRNPETERYRLGIGLLGLAAQVASYMDVREVARPLLRTLADRCGETVNLSVLDAGEVVNLEQFVNPARQIKSIGWVGRRTPPHCTAAGKVLLAYSESAELEPFLQAELERHTPRTITDHAAFRQELARVREQGYAETQEELEEGLNVVAAPIRDHTGHVVASISVSGPAYRVSPKQFPELAAQLIRIASEIARQLGYKQR